MNTPEFNGPVSVANKEIATLYRTIYPGDRFYSILIDRTTDNPDEINVDFKFLAEIDIDCFKRNYAYVNDELKLWKKRPEIYFCRSKSNFSESTVDELEFQEKYRFALAQFKPGCDIKAWASQYPNIFGSVKQKQIDDRIIFEVEIIA